MERGVSVVVPCYKSPDTLDNIVQRVAAALTPTNIPFEVLFIEDRGPDDGKTWRTIQRLAEHNVFVRGIRLSANKGQHNALLCGIRNARFDVTVTMDDDLQNPPECIPELLAALDGADLVYGAPRKKQHNFVQNVGSAFVRAGLSFVSGSKKPRNVSAFRAFRTKLRAAFADYHGRTVSIDALLGWGTDDIATAAVDHHPRTAGESSYTLFKLIGFSLQMVVAYSTLPLRVASFVGFFFFFTGIGFLSVTVFGRLTGSITVPGFAYIISLMSIFAGAQMFTLGIFGEYLARIYHSTMWQPPYVIDEMTESTTNSTSASVSLGYSGREMVDAPIASAAGKSPG